MSYDKLLYQKDSKGRAKVWSVTTSGDSIIVSYGLVGGKITQKVTKAKPKNIGKSNETTAPDQARLEAQSKWNKQVDREDYHWDIDQAGKQLRPMLARDYTSLSKQVDWSGDYWCVQPKLDGLRLVYGKRTEWCIHPELLTRKGEVYKVPHISKLGDDLTQIICDKLGEESHRFRGLDGELYIHGMPLNRIASRAKKYKKDLTEELEYHLFDLIIEGMPFIERHNLLSLCMLILKDDKDIFKLVPYANCINEEDMIQYHGEFTCIGYEGIMIRNNNSEYAMAQRPDCLYKYKKFLDAEYEILNVWEDRNGCAMLTLNNPLGEGEHRTFNCTPKRTHKERKEMLGDTRFLIGKWIKVKYQALTEYNVPEFPVGLEIREVDDDGKPLE